MTDLEIPTLDETRLAGADMIPSTVYGGGEIVDPAHTLFLWRSVGTQAARGGVIGFYLDDWRLEPIWTRPSHYAKQFKRCGIKAAVEVDYSLWCDRPLEEQRYNIFRTRMVSRIFQGAGLLVAPNLSWSTPASYRFCFAGVPPNAPVAFTEARTAGSCDEDRRAFLNGLHAAVEAVKPQTLIIYGGARHRWWIERDLPVCDTNFVFLESWTDARRAHRANIARQEQEKNQLKLFGGNETWELVA